MGRSLQSATRRGDDVDVSILESVFSWRYQFADADVYSINLETCSLRTEADFRDLQDAFESEFGSYGRNELFDEDNEDDEDDATNPVIGTHSSVERDTAIKSIVRAALILADLEAKGQL